jgi:hypothetical protein
LQDIECPDFPFSTQPTDAGTEAVQVLQHAIFGRSSLQQSLMHSVFCGSLAQVRHILPRHGVLSRLRALSVAPACCSYPLLLLFPFPSPTCPLRFRLQAQCMMQLCMAVLLDSLAPHNCLTLYSMAASCKCRPLETAARAFALRHFSAAAQLDYAGLTMLPSRSLMAFLCSDALQVSTVCRALVLPACPHVLWVGLWQDIAWAHGGACRLFLPRSPKRLGLCFWRLHRLGVRIHQLCQQDSVSLPPSSH